MMAARIVHSDHTTWRHPGEIGDQLDGLIARLAQEIRDAGGTPAWSTVRVTITGQRIGVELSSIP